MAIACRNEVDLASGHKRKKQGDCIIFNPYPWKWTNRELKTHFIIMVSYLTKDKMIELCEPYYTGGKRFYELKDEDNLIPLAKRRYMVPLDIIKDGWYPQLDISKVENAKIIYQPLRDSEITINAQEMISIFYDKYKDSFKYITRKVI